MSKIWIELEAEHIGFGAACTKQELPDIWEKLRSQLEGTELVEEEPKLEPKKKGFMSLKKK